MIKSVNFKQISVYRGPEESPGYLLWRVSTRWRRAIEAVLKTLDLTHPQFVVLACIGWLTRQEQKATQIAIGQQAGLDPNTTSQILRGLQTKGLIERMQSSDDERSKYPVLTKQGALRLAKALPTVEKADIEFFKCLGSNNKSFLKILQKLQ